MHSHDPDIVAALAEGNLSPTEERAAIAGIDDCARCSTDLTSQRFALEAIRSAETPALTPEESTQLRASIAEAIGLPAPTPEAERRKRRIPWPAISIAAASLAAIVAVVPVMGLLNTSADDSGGDAVAAIESVTSMATLEVGDEFSARDGLDAAAPPGTEELSVAEVAPSQTEPGGGDDTVSSAAPATTVNAYGATAKMLTIDDLQLLITDRVRIGTLDLSYDEECTGIATEHLNGEVFQPAGDIDVAGVGGKAFVIVSDDGVIERAVVLSISDCSVLFTTP